MQCSDLWQKSSAQMLSQPYHVAREIRSCSAQTSWLSWADRWSWDLLLSRRCCRTFALLPRRGFRWWLMGCLLFEAFVDHENVWTHTRLTYDYCHVNLTTNLHFLALEMRHYEFERSCCGQTQCLYVAVKPNAYIVICIYKSCKISEHSKRNLG